MIYERRRLIDFAPRNHWLLYGGIVINHCLLLSSSFSCGNSSSSSNIVNANVSRRIERLELERASIYELVKARGRNKEGDAQFSEKDIIPGAFGSLVFGPFSSMSQGIFHTMSNIDNIVGVEYSDSKSESHVQHQQSTRLVKGSYYTAVIKSRPSKKAKAAHKVTKTNVSKKQVDTELQQSRQRWESERDVIARIVQLGQKLGHTPTYLDLYCAGFEPAQLDAISDLLQPLLASDEDAEVVPWVEAPLELVVA